MRRILLVRHGQSQGNVDDTKYIDPGDPHLELTDAGWQQAYDAGKFLRWYYRNNPPETGTKPVVWSSTYMRARQTREALLKGMQRDDLRVREDSRLVEQSYGSAAWSLSDDDRKRELGRAREVYKSNPFLTPLPHGESLMNQFMRVDSFIETMRRAEIKRGESDMIIVSHGATMKNFLMRWFHIPDYQWAQIDTPNNCDVIAITYENGRAQARKIYDGEARHIALGNKTNDTAMGDPFARLRPVEIPGPRIPLI